MTKTLTFSWTIRMEIEVPENFQQDNAETHFPKELSQARNEAWLNVNKSQGQLEDVEE